LLSYSETTGLRGKRINEVSNQHSDDMGCGGCKKGETLSLLEAEGGPFLEGPAGDGVSTTE
jgi:hypothetical protein